MNERKVLAVTGRDIRVVYTKYDGSLHWHQTWRYLGQDEHGVWAGAPAGSFAQRGDEPPILQVQNSVLLVPPEQWWTAVFNAEPADTEIYCDISTTARWTDPGEVTMVDLDLDVIRVRADQKVLLLDEDEFAEHQIRYGYPDDVIGQAREAAQWLLQAVGDGTEPFAGGYRAWLDEMA
jgi:uncharacterized protein